MSHTHTTKRATTLGLLLLDPVRHAPCQCARSAKGIRLTRPLITPFLQALLPAVFEVSNHCESTLSGQAYRATAQTSFGCGFPHLSITTVPYREVSRLGNRGSEKPEGRIRTHAEFYDPHH